jgi:hypothetical protein
MTPRRERSTSRMRDRAGARAEQEADLEAVSAARRGRWAGFWSSVRLREIEGAASKIAVRERCPEGPAGRSPCLSFMRYHARVSGPPLGICAYFAWSP